MSMLSDPNKRPLAFAETWLAPWPDAEENARLAWETAEEMDDLAACCDDADNGSAACDALAFVETTACDRYTREFCVAFVFVVFCLRKTTPRTVH